MKPKDIILWELYDKTNQIYIRPEKKELWENKEANRNLLLNRIVSRLTSAEKLTLDNQSVMIKYVKFKEKGKGGYDKQILNKDNNCFIYALYLGYLYYTNKKNFNNASQRFRKSSSGKCMKKR